MSRASIRLNAALVVRPPSTENEWRLIPLTTSLVPFKYTPSWGKNSTVRKPMRVSLVCTILPSGFFNSNLATYRLGFSVDQGMMLAHSPLIICSLSELLIEWVIVVCPLEVYTVFPSFNERTDTMISCPLASPAISTAACNFPWWSAFSTKCSMCICGRTSSHTGRYIPPNNHQSAFRSAALIDLLADSLATFTSSWFFLPRLSNSVIS